MLAIAAVVVACEKPAPDPEDPTKEPTETPEGPGTEEPEVTEDGTEAHPYLLKTTDDLAAMREKALPGTETWFRLENDIDMTGVTNWTPINFGDTEGEGETAVTTFDRKIHFDGNNKVISNFAPATFNLDKLNEAAYPSFFGVLYGSCKDLTITNAVIADAKTHAGILAGYVGTVDKPATVTNVSVQGTVSGNINRIGGLAGVAVSSTFTNCTADVAVTTTNTDAGGFVGYVEGISTFTNCNVKVALISSAIEKCRCGGFIGWNRATETTIENCHVLEGSTITDQSVGRDAAKVVMYGGFIGFGDSDAELTKLTVKNSSAKVTVNSQDFAQVNSCFIGALGYSAEVLLDGCSAEGDILIGANPQNYAAGLVARAQFAGAKDAAGNAIEGGKKLTINNCSFKGNVKGRAGVGGLVGAIDAGEMTITNSTVEGTVQNFQNNIGGIIGSTVATATSVKIEGCSFDGTVEGVSYVGGIAGGIGANQPEFIISRTYSKGEIKSSNSYAGGIVGAAQGLNQVITNCYSTANVSLTGATGKQIGGLVGTATDPVKISNSFASGDINTISVAGGLLGRAGKAGCEVKNSIAWNANITATTSSLVGAIIGSMEKDGDYSNCYRRSDMVTTNSSSALADQENITTVSAAGAYHGKAAAAGATISSVAKQLGWDETIWDLSKDVPALK